MRSREMVEQKQLNKSKSKRSSQDKRSRIRRRKREKIMHELKKDELLVFRKQGDEG